MTYRFNICPGLILDCCFWTGWYALSCLLSNNNPFAATTIFAAGASFFELLWQLQDWHPEGNRLSMSLANFVSGVWLHYATTRPLFMTPSPSFFNILTLICSVSLSTLKVFFECLRFAPALLPLCSRFAPALPPLCFRKTRRFAF